MTIQIIGAMLAAFCITRVFGTRLIPWLEKHGFRQQTKDEVEQTIYLKKNDSADCSWVKFHFQNNTEQTFQKRGINWKCGENGRMSETAFFFFAACTGRTKGHREARRPIIEQIKSQAWSQREEFATFFPGNLRWAVVHYNHRKGKSTDSKDLVTAEIQVQILQRSPTYSFVV